MDGLGPLSRRGDIELGTDLPFERRWWVFERLVWAIMVVVIALGALGLLGRGPLSTKVLQVPSAGMSVTYDRLAHCYAPAVLTISVDKKAAGGGKTRIHLRGDFVNEWQIKHIMPPPLEAQVSSAGASYTFLVDSHDDEPKITFLMEPVTYGRSELEIALDGHAPLHLRQFVFP